MARRSFGRFARTDGQLDLFAPMPPEQIEDAPPTLPATLNGLANHGPWPGLSSWSWLHAFALERHTDGRVYTIHPAFDGVNWLDGHAKALGYRPVYAECMAARRREGEGRFASDFCTTRGWHELLEFRHLTTPRRILEAVADGVYRYQNPDTARRLDHASARDILLALGAKEPDYCTDAEMIDAVVSQDFFDPKDLLEVAWKRIHAWELGLVRYRKGIAEPVEQRMAA
jgi:hypothetical protein